MVDNRCQMFLSNLADSSVQSLHDFAVFITAARVFSNVQGYAKFGFSHRPVAGACSNFACFVVHVETACRFVGGVFFSAIDC